VIDGESEVDDCDEVICAGWGEPGQWTEWGWRMRKEDQMITSTFQSTLLYMVSARLDL